LRLLVLPPDFASHSFQTFWLFQVS
jgi:hypothetical protein